MKGKKRCRLHGGRAGAPKGNRNAWKHGGRSAEAKSIREMLKSIRGGCL
ncbi:hypothetical protein [Sphingomonas oligoaromativorans]